MALLSAPNTTVSERMRLPITTLLLAVLMTASANAVPMFFPYPGAEFTATIKEFKPVKAKGLDPVVVIVLDDHEGLSEEMAKKLYKALRHKARYRVRYPKKNSIELVFKKEKIKKLKIGDRVKVSKYFIQGHSESSGYWLSEGVEIVKIAKQKR